MGTSDITAALQRVRSVLERKPETGLHDDSEATAVWRHGTRVVTAHPNGTEVESDMPAELGGSGDRVTPGWFFRAGLASCAATSLALGAAQRGLVLSRLEVRATSRSDTRGMLRVPEADGTPVYAGPAELRLRVCIAAEGASDEALRALVHDCLGHSPIPCAVRQATDLRIDVETE